MRSVSTLALLSTVGLFAACAPEGSSAYVSYNIPPAMDCTFSPTATLFIASGLYDIGKGSYASGCRHSYFMHLLVNSNLKANALDSTGRAEPNVLQITSADVRLMDKNQATLNFPCAADSTTGKYASNCPKGSLNPALPNPFRVETANSLPPTMTTAPSTGVVEIEAIPKAYGPKLTGYNDDNILVEVQVFGTTTGDVDIDFKPFVYPVAICESCLSKCLGETGGDNEPTVLGLYGTKCVDNSAQDGRWCIDPCTSAPATTP